jgi:hypothetical protein
VRIRLIDGSSSIKGASQTGREQFVPPYCMNSGKVLRNQDFEQSLFWYTFMPIRRSKGMMCSLRRWANEFVGDGRPDAAPAGRAAVLASDCGSNPEREWTRRTEKRIRKTRHGR